MGREYSNGVAQGREDLARTIRAALGRWNDDGEPVSLCVCSLAEKADLAAEQIERLEAERRELEEGLSEMVSWARDIAGDCVDDKQREMEEDMMERMDALLARVRAQENSDE